ncbi:MAG: hypothetical protein EYC70_14850 [Planctomycetota bacterium]|nr:MAG: hypothetical protein EYC70_14850 [Planctomycetota bacterium]
MTLLCGLALAALLVQEEPAAAGAPVVVVTLQGELDETWASLLRRAIEQAQREGADTFLVELDTPGGEAELMKRLGDLLSEAGESMETAVFVTHRAWSAGAYIAMAAQHIWMAPGATMGAAMPVAIGPGGLLPVGAGNEDLEEKILSAFRTDFRAWAEQHQRDPRVAEAFVDRRAELKYVAVEGERALVDGQEHADMLARGETPQFLETVDSSEELLVLTPERARELGYCDGVATDRGALLVALGLAQRPLLPVDRNWSEALVAAIGRHSWLILVGIAFCLIVAFNMPGLGGAEFLAVFLLALFLFRGYLVGLAEWTEVGLVALGALLLLVELFLLPGSFVPGVLGVLLLGGGLLLSMQNFVLPEGAIEADVFQRNLLIVLALVLAAPLLGLMALRKLSRSRFGARWLSIPGSDFAGPVAGGLAAPAVAQVAPGDPGVALTPLRPAGRVEIAGAPFDARSTGGFVPSGATVRVVRREGASLLVTPVEEP